MKRSLMTTLAAGMLALASVLAVAAQGDAIRSAAGDKWVITASAGGVNHLEGTVKIVRPDGRSGLLLKRDTVQVGDVVSTESDGRAEILLNPGSYLRVDGNSEFSFGSTKLEDVEIKVNRGSAIFEVFADNDFKVAVDTPSQRFELIRSGVYRVDVDSTGVAKLEVWKGRAEVGDEVVKGGRTVTGDDGQVAIQKFDRDNRDAFEAWSRDRAKELAKSTSAFKDKALRGPLMNSFLGGGWNMYNSFGLWVYDPFRGRFGFLPFGYGWSSPYGFGYRTDIWWYGLPRIIMQPPTYNPPSGGGTANPVPTPPRIREGDRGRRSEENGRGVRPAVAFKPPPFSRIQGKDSTGPVLGGGGLRSVRGSDGDGFRGVRPIFSAPVSAPPAAAPASPPPIRGSDGMRRGNN